MTLINLECVLSDATERVEKRWNLKGKPSYIGIMTGSSIEACSLGNNHTYDYGQAGLDDTRNVLDNAGIVYGFNDHTGIYETADGTRIGIVSVSLLSVFFYQTILCHLLDFLIPDFHSLFCHYLLLLLRIPFPCLQ